MCDDLILKHRISCIVTGTSGSGKTSFCTRYLQKFNALCTEREFDGGIIWCYSEKTAVPSHQQLPTNINYKAGVQENISNARGKPCRVIQIICYSTFILRKCVTRLPEIVITEMSAWFWLHKISFITVEIFRWMPIICSRCNTSEIRSSSCIWPINYIPKIILGCVTLTSMRLDDPKFTSSWIWHKIWMAFCSFEPTYSQQNTLQSSTLIYGMKLVITNYHALHLLRTA